MSCIINGNTSTYRYGADGLRRQKTVNGTTTDSAYDATMLVREGHAAGGSLTPATVTATYFQGASGPCYRRDDTQPQTDGQGHTFGKTGWYVYDGLGSVVGEMDPLGNLTSRPKYDVYGAVRANPGTATSRQGFVGSLGHVTDTETGLIYMQARYMDPSTGRFVSEDMGRNNTNWYLYCSDDPNNRVDQSGRFDLMAALQVIEQIFGAANQADVGGVIKQQAWAYLQAQFNILLGKATARGWLAGEENEEGELERLAGDEVGGSGEQLKGATDAIGAANNISDAVGVEQLMMQVILDQFSDSAWSP